MPAPSHFLGCEAEAVRTGAALVPGAVLGTQVQCPLLPAPGLYRPALWTNTMSSLCGTLG